MGRKANNMTPHQKMISSQPTVMLAESKAQLQIQLEQAIKDDKKEKVGNLRVRIQDISNLLKARYA